MAPARTFSVAVAKGGVGKTTTSLDLAAGLPGGGPTVVEFDLATANSADFPALDCAPDVDPTLHDVLASAVPPPPRTSRDAAPDDVS